MRNVILFLVSLLLYACGSGGENTKIDTTKSVDREDVGKNQDDLPYPGFYDVQNGDKSGLRQDSPNYRDCFFDRHESTLRKDQTFYMDVVTREVMQDFADYDQSSSSADVAYSYSVDIHRGLNVEADYGTSDLFLLYGTTNYVDVIISWDVDERPEDLKEHKFFICNPDNIEENLLDDQNYILPDEAWDIPREKASTHYLVPISKPGKYGLCRQYKDYEAVIYDVLNVKEYDGSDFDVSVVNVGNEENLKMSNIIDKNNYSYNYYYRAGIDINYSFYNYDVPDVFEDERFKGSYHIDERSKYLFVRGPFVDENADHSCYEYIKDDLYYVNSKIKHDVQSNALSNRTAIVYNKTHVKFWTFYENSGYVYPCISELSDNDEDAARPYANKEYKVVILNADLNKCLSWEGSNYEVDYDRMYIKNDGKQWKAYDTYKKEYSLSQFKDIFNPECHAFIDMSSSQQLNSTSKKYLKKIITGDALGLTDEIVVDYPGRSIGLWAFINPINGERTFMHEMGHLLGLADVNDTKNLMHWNKSDGFMLNNRLLEAKACADPKEKNCRWITGSEMQWDCLNGVNVTSSCLLEKHRNF